MKMQAYSAGEAMKAGIFCWDNVKREQITDSRALVVIAVEWFRDCDMCESTTLRAYPATEAHIDRAFADMEDSAEGPWSLDFTTLEVAADTTTGSRDLALEAFEDGRGANAYNVTPEN